jgi:hypothetical protein
VSDWGEVWKPDRVLPREEARREALSRLSPEQQMLNCVLEHMARVALRSGSRLADYFDEPSRPSSPPGASR